MSEPPARVLPLAGAPPIERADAARNRERILAAADRVIARTGVDGLTMDEVAWEAGVGKGTLFRRFDSRAGLMAAILDRSEREWQESVLSGPPPLGPGADPLARLLALGHSRMRRNLKHLALMHAAVGPQPGRNFAVIGFVVMHVRFLLEELSTTGDLDVLALQLVATLDPPVVAHMADGLRMSHERIDAGWDDLVRKVVG